MVAFLIGLAINLAIQIGLNVLARLLEPGRKRPKPQPFQSPTASSGTPLGKGFGIFEAQPTVVVVDEPTVSEEKHEDLDITRYYARMVLVLGWGPIDVLYDIASDERSIRTQRPGELQSLNGGDLATVGPLINEDDPRRIPLPFDFIAETADAKEFSINVRQIYGGGGEEGGLQGLLMLYRGVGEVVIDPLVAELDGDFASGFPWTVYARLGAETGRPEGTSAFGLNQQGDRFYFVTNNPTPKSISFILGAYPKTLLEDNGRIGLGCNLVEAIYEIYTDTKWGLGKSPDRFDIPNWIAGAERIKKEGLSISIPRDDPQSGDDIIEDILRHGDAGIVEDPETGLLQIKFARDDYDVESLLIIGKHNTEDFKRGKPLQPKSINDVQVKYRRFLGGVGSELVTELVTDSLENFNALPVTYVWNSSGTDLIPESVKVFVDDVEVPVIFDTRNPEYFVDPVVCFLETGVFWFMPTDEYGELLGSKIEVEYAASPKFVAFIDEVATAQNIANQRGLGQHQPESYDYPYYIDAVSAQWKADRLLMTLSRTIDTFTWKGMRDQSHLTPWDVVQLLEPEWGITTPIPIRITKVDYGTRTDPGLTFEGVFDIWGEKVILSNLVPGGPPTPPTLPTAPAMAIACGTHENLDFVRIDFFPTDVNFSVEVYEADDELGTNSIVVATIPAATDPKFYLGSEGKFYAARQYNSFFNPGPLTPWITCHPVIVDPPIDPECELPTWEITAIDLEGLITVVLDDPQHRVSLVEFRHRTGGGTWSNWTATDEPYCDAVTLSAIECSRIEWRITYQGCDGVTAVASDGHDFCPTPAPPEPPDEPEPVFIQELEVVLHAGGMWPIGLDEIEVPAEGTRLPLTPFKATEVKTPITWATKCYVAASILKANLPTSIDQTTCYLVIRGRIPVQEGGAWESLGPLDTPRIPLDKETLLLMDDEAQQVDDLPVCVAGDWIDIRDEFLGAPLHIAADIVGADGTVLQEVIITRLSVWLRKAPTDGPPSEPPETEAPPPIDPGSCDVPTPVSMSAGTEEDEGGSATEWVRGSTSATLTISGSASGHSRIRETFTGLTPSEKYTFYITINTNGKPAVEAFLEVVGGTSQQAGGSEIELEAYGYPDGAGNLDVLWGVDNIGGAGAGAAINIDTEDWTSVGDILADGYSEVIVGGSPPTVVMDAAFKESGARSIQFHINHSAWTSGQRYFEKFIAGGFTPGAQVVASVRFRHQDMPWYANPIFTVGVTATGLTYDKTAAGLGWIDLVCSGGEIDDNGDVYIRFGGRSGASVVQNFKVWFDGVITITVAGAGTFEIDFSDLGFCVGSGKGDDDTGVGGDPDNPGNEPIPDPPPGGWPDPPQPLERWFGIYGIPPQGLAFWNSTMIRATVKATVNILRVCEENDTYWFMTLGPESDWLVGGVFSEARWRAQLKALYDDLATRNAIEKASQGLSPYTKVRVVHQAFDEPFHKTRYGVPIPFATVERCCIYSKELFPFLEVNLRVDPTDVRYARKMVGNDTLWGEYSLARGNIDTYISTRKARIEQLEMQMYMGLHYKHFEGPAGPDPRYITPTELRHYGRDKMAKLSWIRGLLGWKFETGLWSQSGMPTSVQETRDEFSLSQP